MVGVKGEWSGERGWGAYTPSSSKSNNFVKGISSEKPRDNSKGNEKFKSGCEKSSTQATNKNCSRTFLDKS